MIISDYIINAQHLNCCKSLRVAYELAKHMEGVPHNRLHTLKRLYVSSEAQHFKIKINYGKLTEAVDVMLTTEGSLELLHLFSVEICNAKMAHHL